MERSTISADRMMRSLWLVAVVLYMTNSQGTLATVCDGYSYCYPADSDCWPTTEEFTTFGSSLTGKLLFPQESEYEKIVIMKDTRVTKHPGVIVIVKNAEDVRKAIAFARQHKMRITVQSSGHDFIGRSTADDSLQINLSEMTSIEVNLTSSRNDAGEITVESGNPWKDIYPEVDKYGRIVVGGSSHTVSPGGYTLGGGHSPMSPALGLAVDNVLEFEMVTSDGRIVQASATGTRIDASGNITETSDTDLFFALRGGGGGTFGVVTKYTYKLHFPPPQFVRLICGFQIWSLAEEDTPIREVLKFTSQLMKNIPSEWGGYFLTIPTPYNATDYGTLLFAMLHYGPWESASRKVMDSLVNFKPDWQTIKCFYINYTTFWDYEKTVEDQLYTRSYIYNTLLQPNSMTDGWAEQMIKLMTQPPEGSAPGCTSAQLGGRVNSVGDDDTAVNPALRSASQSLTCYLGWAGEDKDEEYSNAAIQFGREMQEFGDGVYLNEPSEHLPNWKTDFWGKHYARLLSIKHVWDPDNIFSCKYCVGSDEPGPYQSADKPPSCKAGVLVSLPGGTIISFLVWNTIMRFFI